MSEPHSPTEGRAASMPVDAAPPALAGTYAGPFLTRLAELEDQLATERDRRVRAERLATSLAQRVANEHQRLLVAAALDDPERDAVAVAAVAGGDHDRQSPGPFARWRNLRPRAAELDDRD